MYCSRARCAFSSWVAKRALEGGVYALAGPYLGILLHRAVRAVVGPADLSAGYLTFLRTEHLLSSSSAAGPPRLAY